MLGECYFRGYGVPVNLREARKWFQRAANQVKRRTGRRTRVFP